MVDNGENPVFRCFLCGGFKEAEHFSVEHIIPQAIGGRLSHPTLVCRGCNSDSGASIDASLAKTFETITTVFDIKRQRGNNKEIILTTKDERVQYRIGPGGKHTRHVKIRRNGEKEFWIYYETEAELERLRKQVSKRKAIVAERKITEGKPGSVPSISTLLFRFDSGSREALRSIVKTGALFYLFHQGQDAFISAIAGYINGFRDGQVIFPFVSVEPIWPEPTDTSLIHTLVLNGSYETGLLWVYVELFNTFSYSVILSRNYIGPKISHSYAINVISGQEIPLESLDLSPPSRNPTLRDIKASIKLIRPKVEHLARLLSARILKTSVGKELANDLHGYPKGTIISETIAEDLANRLFTVESSGITINGIRTEDDGS